MAIGSTNAIKKGGTGAFLEPSIIETKGTYVDETDMGVLPSNFSGKSAVVYNNEIHIMGGSYDPLTHYAWNGTSWRKLPDLPYEMGFGASAVVYNNEIHTIGGMKNNKAHYAWDGIDWKNKGEIPSTFYNGCVVVYKDDIHVLGGSSDNTGHYYYSYFLRKWVTAPVLPFVFLGGSAMVYDNEMYICGSEYSTSNRYFYKWDGSTWTKLTDLPNSWENGSAIVYRENIYSMLAYNRFYRYNGKVWTDMGNLSRNINYAKPVVYNDKIYVLGYNKTEFYSVNFTDFTTSYTFNLPKSSEIYCETPITAIGSYTPITNGIKTLSDGEITATVLTDSNITTYV